MKINYLIILAAAGVLSSCSTAYRSGQTPDDVYYSPAPVAQENSYVSAVNTQDKNSYAYRNEEDMDIRRGIDNPIYRSPISLSLSMGYGYSPYSLSPYNNFMNPYSYGGYGYSPYGLKGLYNPYNSYYSPFYNDLSFYSPYSYNSFYSPYSFGYSPLYSPILFSSKNVNTNRGARKYNLNPYNSASGVRANDQPIRNSETGTVQPARGNGVGNVIRRVFTPQENRRYVTPNSNNNNRTYNNRTYNTRSNENNSYQTPQRSFNNNTPSISTPSSSSPSSSSNSAPVRSFRR